METKLLKNRKEEVILSRLHIGHTRTTNSYLLEVKQQPTYHACQTKYTVKYILIECTNLAHIRETFYSANDLAHIREPFYCANDMKELFQNIEIKNVMSFLKVINIYRKIKKKFQQDQISPTNCSSTRNTSTKSDPFHKLFTPPPQKKFFYYKTILYK